MTSANGNVDGLWSLIDCIYAVGQSHDEWPVLLEGLVNHLGVEDLPAGSSLGDEAELSMHFEAALGLNRHDFDPDSVFLSQIPFPLLVLREPDRVVYRSQERTPYLPPDGPLELDGDRLRLGDPEIADRLEGLFRAGAERPSPMCLFEESGGQKVYAIPLPGASGPSYVALAWPAPVGEAPLSVDEMRELYGLTAAEAALARRLVVSPETADLARDLSVAEDSVRTQLKRIYLKTGTSRKAELVQRILCGPALLARVAPSGKRLFDVGGEARRNQTLSLPDGRRLGFAEYGDKRGAPVLFLHNLLGSRLQLPTHERGLRDQGVRLIVLDRPGIGESDPLVPFSLRTWSEDVIRLADHLALPQLAVIGWSVGAIYCLALARYQPQRVSRCAMVSILPEVESNAALREHPASTRGLFLLARYAPRLLRLMVRLILRSGPDTYLEKRMSELPPEDRRLYEDPGLREMIASAIQENLRQGGVALLQDVLLMANSWEFDPADVTTPVDCWHGELDPTAPVALALRMAERHPNATVQVVPGETHWTLFRHWNRIMARVLGRTAR
ncbi:MAG: alpha/beta hydrolase [Proteobacteria bacterium]|nr:alpha/beta hydrolase [Pseudomonadota bacterium]